MTDQQTDLRDRIAAYRSPGTRTLYCVTCARQEPGWTPVPTADVQDWTCCDFCGSPVLAVASQTLAGVVARHVDAASAVLPPPAARATVLREEAALIRAHCPDHLDSQSAEGSWIDCHCDVADDMERRAAEAQQPDTETPTPCDQPNACDPDTGELCATHEEEKAHADGEHEYCSVTCEVAMPTELMRNSLIAWAPPGGKGILAELERRAAAGAGRVADEEPRP